MGHSGGLQRSLAEEGFGESTGCHEADPELLGWEVSRRKDHTGSFGESRVASWLDRGVCVGGRLGVGERGWL